MPSSCRDGLPVSWLWSSRFGVTERASVSYRDVFSSALSEQKALGCFSLALQTGCPYRVVTPVPVCVHEVFLRTCA